MHATGELACCPELLCPEPHRCTNCGELDPRDAEMRAERVDDVVIRIAWVHPWECA